MKKLLLAILAVYFLYAAGDALVEAIGPSEILIDLLIVGGVGLILFIIGRGATKRPKIHK